MRRNIIALAMLCCLVSLVLGLSYTPKVDTTGAIKVYYLSNSGSPDMPSELVYELRSVGDLSDEERLAAALKLMRTPLDKRHSPVLPKTLFITNSFISGDTATIDLTSKYGDMKPSKRIVLTAAMAMSAFELDSVQVVKINAFGSSRLPDADTIFIRSSFRMDESAVAIYSHDLDLFYVDMKNLNLTCRSVTMKLVSPVLTAEDLIFELLESSEGQGLNRPFDGNLSLDTVSIEDGTCYINFHNVDIFDDAYLNYLSVYSIVNTVCSLDDVDCAVLTVDDLPLSKNGINFCDGPLTPVVSVVSK